MNSVFTTKCISQAKLLYLNVLALLFIFIAALVYPTAGSGGAVQQWYAWGQDTNTLLNQVNIAVGTRATLIADSQNSFIGSNRSVVHLGY